MRRRSESRDPGFRASREGIDEECDLLVRDVDEVLLTRGMIGTLICSTDPETRDLLRSLIASHRTLGTSRTSPRTRLPVGYGVAVLAPGRQIGQA